MDPDRLNAPADLTIGGAPVGHTHLRLVVHPAGQVDRPPVGAAGLEPGLAPELALLEGHLEPTFALGQVRYQLRQQIARHDGHVVQVGAGAAVLGREPGRRGDNGANPALGVPRESQAVVIDEETPKLAVQVRSRPRLRPTTTVATMREVQLVQTRPQPAGDDL